MPSLEPQKKPLTGDLSSALEQSLQITVHFIGPPTLTVPGCTDYCIIQYIFLHYNMIISDYTVVVLHYNVFILHYIVIIALCCSFIELLSDYIAL